MIKMIFETDNYLVETTNVDELFDTELGRRRLKC